MPGCVSHAPMLSMIWAPASYCPLTLSSLSPISPVSQLESSWDLVPVASVSTHHDSYQHISQHMVTHPLPTASPQTSDCPHHPQRLDYHLPYHHVWSVMLCCHRDWLGRGILEKVFISCMSEQRSAEREVLTVSGEQYSEPKWIMSVHSNLQYKYTTLNTINNKSISIALFQRWKKYVIFSGLSKYRPHARYLVKRDLND